MPDIQVPKCFKPIFEGEKLNYLLESGRISGKSKNAYILSGITAATNPNEDIVIARASYGSIGDSAYNEVVDIFDDIDAFNGMFKYRTSPYRIIRNAKVKKPQTIYFIGAGGSTDRTKGLKTKNPIGLLIIEEAQELKSKEHLDQLMATLRRRFGEHCRVVVCFNPPSQRLHWINVYAEQCRHDKDWTVIHNSWRDISVFLKDRDITEIIKCKYENETYYEYMYEGKPQGMLGLCYPMFRKDLHMVDYESRTSAKVLQDFRIVGCIIGVDAAVTHDCTAFTPLLIMSNGQCAVGKIFYHNPLEDGVQASFKLVENYVSRWFKELKQDNDLDNPYDYMQSVPIAFIVDSAATDMVQALQYFFSNRAMVYAVKKGTIPQMVGVVQNAIGKNLVTIYDYGGYFNYIRNRFIKTQNVLAYQLEMLKWNEKETGYDDIIPNDVCDSFTYAIWYYYKNTENLVWLDAIIRTRQDYYRVKE